jgi:4-hydroxy-3-polyprenylbenzoate decarboxylase
LIVKGYFEPRGLMRDEGSFGDHTSYCTLCDPYPVFHVTAITHRKYAVYSATIICIPRI